MERFEIVTKLSENGILSSFRAIDSKLGKTVTLCRIITQETEKIEKKLQFLLDLKHDNLYEYFEIFSINNPPAESHEDSVYIVKSFYEECESLEEYIQREFISMELLVSYMCQICKGLEYIHSLNLIHGELQPRRIVIYIKDGKEILKINDFNFYGSIQDVLSDEENLGSINYIGPEVDHYTSYMKNSDLFALGAMIYKLSRTERIERRWMNVLAENGAGDTIIWDVAWFRPRDLGVLTAQLMDPNPKNRPTPMDCSKELVRILDSKGECRSEMIKSAKADWLICEKDLQEKWTKYENFYCHLDGLDAEMKEKLQFGYIHNMTGYLKEDGTIESFFKKLSSSRGNWFTADHVCNREVYWIDKYENNPKWKELVDENGKLGILSPQEMFSYMQTHIAKLKTFLDDVFRQLDRQDAEYANFEKIRIAAGGIVKRIQENLACRPYGRQIQTLKNTYVEEMQLFNGDFCHFHLALDIVLDDAQLSHSTNYSTHYVMFLCGDLNEGFVVLYPHDDRERRIRIISLGFCLIFKTFSGFFFETIYRGSLWSGLIRMERKSDEILFERHYDKWQKARFEKTNSRFMMQRVLNMIGMSNIVYDDQCKYMCGHNQGIFNTLFDYRPKFNYRAVPKDVSFHFK